MKKYVFALLAIFMFGGTAYADRSEQAQELRSLISEAEGQGCAVDYEKSATAVFEAFLDIEEKNLADSTLTEVQREYNSSSMDRIYNETKNRLQSYLDGTAAPFPAIQFPSDGTRNINGSIFTDADGRPLQSVGFGHFDDVISEADSLKEMGSNNIQNEIGPSLIALPSSINLWNTYFHNQCDADVTVEEESNGNHVLSITERHVEGTYLLIRQYVPVEPKTKYIISLDAEASREASIIVLPDGWNTRYYVSVGTSRTNHSIGTIFTTAEDQHYTEFMIIVDSSMTVKLDNISLKNMKTKENVLKNPDFERTGSYRFFMDNLIDKLEKIQSAADKGFSVDLLISPHYMPQFMLDAYPEMETSGNYTFLDYNVNHPMARQFISDYLEFIMPHVKRYDGIHSICISNEPNFYSSESYDYYNPLFREWMQKKYDYNIENVNKAYGKNGIFSKFYSFSQVSIPSYLKNVSGYPQADPLYYDYMLFNEEQFADWHKMMADIIKKYTPNMPVHSKMQDYLFFSEEHSVSKMLSGTDAEMFSEFTDIAGNDACMYVSSTGTQMAIMMWYDFLSSLTGKPVYNSEDHVIPDGNTDYSDSQAQNVRYSLLSGAVHGRNGSSLWLWDDAEVKGLFRDMPYATYLTGKTMLDMTRLSNELNAFQTAEEDTAFFYSKSSRVMTIYNFNHNLHEEALTKAYEAVSALGHKTGFVTQYAPEKVHNYKTLILAEVRAIPEESVTEIAEFMRNGGNVIIVGSKVLDYGEHGAAVNSDNRTFIKNNAYYVNEQTAKNYNNAYLYFGEKDSFVMENGEIAENIDLKTAEYNGEELIFITNVSDTDKTVSIGNEECYFNLLTGDSVSQALTLTPFEPVILKMEEEHDTAEVVAEFGTDSVNFEVNYNTDIERRVRVAVVVKNDNGDVIGFAYNQKSAFTDKNNTFSGTIHCTSGAEVEVVIFDSVTGSEIVAANTFA